MCSRPQRVDPVGDAQEPVAGGIRPADAVVAHLSLTTDLGGGRVQTYAGDVDGYLVVA